MKHISWNGLGVFLLNNTVVSLMAIHFGATNLELGYINAAFHVTGVVSLFVPRLFQGRRITRVFGLAWMTRGAVAFFYGLLLFLSGPAARFTVLLIFTGFSVSRAVGVSVAHAVQRDVMRDRDLGGSMVRLNIRLGYSQFASQLLSFGLLSLTFFEGIGGLVTIAYIGAIMNTVASVHLLRIPGRSEVEKHGGKNAFRRVLRILRHRHHVIPMLVHCLGMGLHVLFAFQIVFIRRVLGLPDSIAILFTMVGAVAAILANQGLKPFADSVGEKPLLVITTAGLTVVSLIWAVVPGVLPLPVYLGLGFVAFFFLRSLLTLKAAALVKSIPERNRISYTATANVLLGVSSLALGLIGGALADLAATVPRLVVHEYSLTFLFTGLIAVATMVLSMLLPGGRSLSLRETADIMLSIRNLRAFLDANQLQFAGDPARRESLLLSLERSSTPIATSRLRDRLHGPSVAERERVLRILFRSPRRELLEDIIAEATDSGSYTRRDAIFCLGAYRDTRAEMVLREIVSNDREPEEAAIGLKSLARHGCADLLPVIRNRLERCPVARTELDLAVAESILDPEGPQLQALFERAFARASESFASTRLLIALDRLGLHPDLTGYFRAEAVSPGRGFSDLVEDATEFEVILNRRARLTELLTARDYTELWKEIRTIVENERVATGPAWAGFLAESIVRSEPPAVSARVGSLGAMYVLHHYLDATADR